MELRAPLDNPGMMVADIDRAKPHSTDGSLNWTFAQQSKRTERLYGFNFNFSKCSCLTCGLKKELEITAKAIRKGNFLNRLITKKFPHQLQFNRAIICLKTSHNAIVPFEREQPECVHGTKVQHTLTKVSVHVHVGCYSFCSIQPFKLNTKCL